MKNLSHAIPALWLAMSLSSGAIAQQSAAPATAQPVPGKSLVVNGGFEDGDQVPAAWTKGQDIPGVEYLWTSGVAAEGRASACLRKTENRYFPIAQCQQDIPYSGGAATLHVAAMVKAQDATKAVIDVGFQNASGSSGHATIDVLN